MKELSRLINLSAIIVCLLVTSCGYVSDKAVQNANVYTVNEMQTCKVDLSKLSEIFKENQKEQIKCLQENLVQFTKYVRSKHPGAVTEAELGKFVKRFFEGQSDSIIKGLSLIFQLNMILLKDEADRISHTNISPLFELLIQVNQEAVVLTNILKSMDQDKNQQKFWDLRQQFNESTARFAAGAVGIIEKSPGLAQKLNIREFVLDMDKKIGDGQIDNETIDSFIFFKKLMVGGEEEVITTDELKAIITKLPKVLGLVFDIYYVKGENFKTDTDEIRFYLIAVRNIYHLIKFNQEDFELLTSAQLVKIAEKFIKDYDIDSFKPSIEALKARFIGGKKDSVSLKDLDTTLVIVNDFFEKVYFNHITYDEPVNNYLLSKPQAVTEKDLPLKALPGYDLFPEKARLAQLHASFNDTAANFRYFRDKASGSALYATNISRNKIGLNEVNISKWLGMKLLKAYGHTDAQNQAQISMDEFSKFLLDSKPLLQELKLWSSNFQTFSRNAVLLADLFQQQSNGDQKININEATEYIGMLLTAVEVSGKFSTNLTRLCDPGINSEDPLYEAGCYNENFFDVILNKLAYRKTYPRLAMYYDSVSRAESMDYLKGVEGFARDNNAPGIPVNRRDSTLILGAMINIETTFIRFDKNRDNIIDYAELSEAFFTYRSSIIELAGLKKEQEVYAKAIFLYMASKMEIPKTGTWMTDIQFATFNKCVQSDFCRTTFMDPIEAKRLNIGKLLYYLVNQASAAPKK